MKMMVVISALYPQNVFNGNDAKSTIEDGFRESERNFTIASGIGEKRI